MQWGSERLGIDRIKERLEALPASDRIVAGKPHVVKLSFRAPDGYSLKEGPWSRLVMLGTTNNSYNDRYKYIYKESNAKNLEHWQADVYIPNQRAGTR